MSMFTLISVFSVCSFAFWKINLKTLLSLDFLSKIDIFYTKGESIIPICFVATHLRYKSTASYVDASHLWHSLLVNNPD